MTKKSDDAVFSSIDDIVYSKSVFGEDLYAHAVDYIVEHCLHAVYTAESRTYLIGAYTSLLAYSQAINVCDERTESYSTVDEGLDDVIKTGMSRWLFTINAVKSICGLELSRNTFLITLFGNSTSQENLRRPMIAAIYRYIKTEQENIQKELDALQTKTEPYTCDDMSNLVFDNLLKEFLSACEGIDMAAYAHQDNPDDEKYTAFRNALSKIIRFSNSDEESAVAHMRNKKEGEHK